MPIINYPNSQLINKVINSVPACMPDTMAVNRVPSVTRSTQISNLPSFIQANVSLLLQNIYIYIYINATFIQLNPWA
jgi:hypothetical protein